MVFSLDYLNFYITLVNIENIFSCFLIDIFLNEIGYILKILILKHFYLKYIKMIKQIIFRV